MAESTPLHNALRNTLRSITSGCTLPQQKAVKELLLGIMREGTTVINRLADTGKKARVGKQAERLRRHLGAVDLGTAVEEKISKALPEIEADTVVPMTSRISPSRRRRRWKGSPGSSTAASESQ